MKYGVICYSVHESDIASCDWFDDYESAKEFLANDAQNTYEEEVENGGNDDVNIWIGFDSASLTSCEDEYEWTWHIVSHD